MRTLWLYMGNKKRNVIRILPKLSAKNKKGDYMKWHKEPIKFSKKYETLLFETLKGAKAK